MPECHDCEHRSEIDVGRYREVPFEKTPCATCELNENPPVYPVAFDDERLTERVAPEPTPANTDYLPVVVLLEFVKAFLSLPRELRDVVGLRYQGYRYADIAAAQGTTAAGAEARHRRAMRMAPILGTLFRAKLNRQKSRNVHERPRRQLEMGRKQR